MVNPKRKEEEAETAAHASGTVPLKPGQSGVVELTASRGEIEAQVDYEQRIQGGVFYHFGKKVDGHYLWYVPLSQLYTTRSDLNQTQTETLNVRVYSEIGNRLVAK